MAGLASDSNISNVTHNRAFRESQFQDGFEDFLQEDPRTRAAKRLVRVDADLGAGQEAIDAQLLRNQQIEDAVQKVDDKIRLGQQLAGRRFAAQRNLAQASGLTLSNTAQQLTNRNNYAHDLTEMKGQYIAFGEHEPFFGNMDPTTQKTGLQIVNTYDAMTPQQQRIASMGARAARGPMTPFNQGFQANLLLITQQRLREQSMYAYV